MVLPALQVRVPNPANALLQAEQIKGARAQTAEAQRVGRVNNALLTAFQEAGGIPTTPEGRQSLVNQVAAIDPMTALSVREQLRPPAPQIAPAGSGIIGEGGNILNTVPRQPTPPLSRERFEQDLALRTAGRPQQNVTVEAARQLFGNPPPGFAWARNEDQSVRLVPSVAPDGTPRLDAAGQPILAPLAVPVAGGPAEAEQQATVRAEEGRRAMAERGANVVTEDIGRLRTLIDETAIPVTGAAALLSVIPGTPQRDARGLLDTIRSNIGFDKLQEMRSNSPTGGALGPVSDFENKLLQATLGSLEQEQREDQFLGTLDRVEDIYGAIIDGPIAGMSRAELAVFARQTNDFQNLTDEERALVARRLDTLEGRGQ